MMMNAYVRALGHCPTYLAICRAPVQSLPRAWPDNNQAVGTLDSCIQTTLHTTPSGGNIQHHLEESQANLLKEPPYCIYPKQVDEQEPPRQQAEEIETLLCLEGSLVSDALSTNCDSAASLQSEPGQQKYWLQCGDNTVGVHGEDQ